MRSDLRLPLLALAGVLALAGCGPAEDRFDLHVTLKGGAGSQDCTLTDGAAPACGDFSVACGAVLSIRVLDDAGDTEYASLCTPFGGAAGDTMCEAGDIGIDLGQVPAGRVRIQVAVWPASVEVCPSEDLFTLTGEPKARRAPGPYMAFGGQTYFDAGDDAVAEVVLSCADPDLVSVCGVSPNTFITARVNDIADGLSVSSIDAGRLLVGVGEPESRINPLPQTTEWVLDPQMVFNLPRQGGALWQGEVNTTFESNACIQVLEDVPQATSTLSCAIVGTPVSDELELTGYLLATPLLNSILGALGLEVFPANGLLIGKVVDALGNPVADAVVTPSTGTVSYVAADFSGVTAGPGTSQNGYFVANDTPFNTTWEASHADGRNQLGAYRGGLVVNKVTAMAIQLESIGVGK